MGDLDITQTTYTDMTSKVTDYAVSTKDTDSASGLKETKWTNPNWIRWLGYWKNIPEYKSAINAYATWVTGRGLEKENAVLNGITGWGEDNFLAIMWNMLVIKKVAGDAYSEVMRSDEGTLINLKPLNNGKMAHIVGKTGIIKRYEYTQADGSVRKFQPNEILHLVNDRVSDEIHGTSVTEAVEWLITARNEAMADWKRISHRSTIRVLNIDEDDPLRMANLKRDYAEAILKGEVLILPGKKEDTSFSDLTLPPVEAYLAWIRYLENAFYKAVGMPKSLTGDVEGVPESGGKMAYLNHEPIYNREVTDLEADLWNQLAIRVKFKRQASLMDSVNDTENKNKAQTGFQPTDVQVGGV